MSEGAALPAFEDGFLYINGGKYPISSKCFKSPARLGGGNFGEVYRVYHEDSATWIARKNFYCCHPSDQDIDILRRVHMALIAPCIVRFFGFTTNLDGMKKVRVYMELMRGSLKDLLASRDCTFDVPMLKYTARSIVDGLVFLLEKMGVIHRDVRPDNVLVGVEGTIKLCDFGISRELSPGSKLCRSTTGCESYLPPERFVSREHDERVDIWALGITLVELFRRRYPYGEHMHAAFMAIVNDPAPVLTSGETDSSDMISFVAACLRKNRAERPFYSRPPDSSHADVPQLPLQAFPFVRDGVISREEANAFFRCFPLPGDPPPAPPAPLLA